MSTIITCPLCGLQGHVPDGIQAPQTQCPRCGAIVAVPASPPAVPQPPPLEPTTARNPGDTFHPNIGIFFAGYTSRPGPPGPLPPPSAGGPPTNQFPTRPPPDAKPDPRAGRELLNEERERLQAHVNRQFAQLRQRRQEFDNYRSQLEADLAARQQELNRVNQLLTDQQQALQQQQAAEAAQREKLVQAEQELVQLRQAAEKIRQEAAVEQGRLDELRKAVAAVKADYLALEAAGNRQRSMAKEASRSAQEEREFRELEKQIRGELERHEQELTHQRRELQAWREQILQESCEKDVLRRKLGILGRELEQLRAKLSTPKDQRSG